MNARWPIYTITSIILAVASCSIPDANIINFEEEQRECVFIAQFEETQTKTAFQSNEISIWWSPGDEIAIYYGASDGNRFTSTNTEETAIAEFRGKIRAFTGETESGDLNYFWAVYPYSSAVSSDGQSVVARLSENQVAKAGTFAPNTNVTIAKSPGLALSFFNACSWFRFSVRKEGVKRVVFRGNSDEDIAGEFRISIGENGRPTDPVVINGKKEITLESPEETSFEVGKMYYFTLFPQVFQRGFTVTFETDTELGVRSIDTKATYLRSKYNTGFEFDKNIEYADKPVKEYSVGELLDSDGYGVVCWVSEDKTQAMLMSATELQGNDWPDSNNWCNSYGNSWRMPTIEELTQIYSNFSLINSSLANAGYTLLTTANKCYWSSTVNPSNSDYYYRERLYDGRIFTSCGSDEKSTSKANYTRAVKMLNK
jgi:hypothetical protein